MSSQHPSSFIGGSSYHPAPTPISRTEDAAAAYAAVPREREQPTLSVSIDNRCVLSRALLAAIPGFKNGCPVLLVVPAYRGGQWYLDTQPKPGTGQHLPASPTARPVFRVPPIGRHHFTQPEVERGPSQPGKRWRPIMANKNTQATLLRFKLGVQVPGHPGYYELVAIPNGGVNH